jgi:predicted XRE-type DNA-binding protein
MNRDSWSKGIEEDLIVLIKDWLKQTGRTQSELCQNLNLTSSRLPTLIDFLKKDFISGGMPKIASRLCEVEESWKDVKKGKTNNNIELNSSGQLDLLDEICEDLSKINFNH